jgi:hypothetical protein
MTCSISFSFIFPWPIAIRAFGTIFWIRCRDRVDRLDTIVDEKDLAVARKFELDCGSDHAFEN